MIVLQSPEISFLTRAAFISKIIAKIKTTLIKIIIFLVHYIPFFNFLGAVVNDCIINDAQYICIFENLSSTSK